MSFFNTLVAIVLTVLLAIFAFQNTNAVTVNFLNFALTAPFAVLAVIVYLLGMWTGSALFSVLRRAMRRRKHKVDR